MAGKAGNPTTSILELVTVSRHGSYREKIPAIVIWPLPLPHPIYLTRLLMPPIIADHPAVLLLGALAVVYLLAKTLLAPNEFPYEAVPALLTPAERTFYPVLRRAVGSDLLIMTKVRLADLLNVERGVSGKSRYRAFNRICAKHVDFVLCDPETFKIVGVIELDDRSHMEKSRRERDTFVDRALTAAGIPIIHIPVQRSYSVAAVREKALAVFELAG